MDDEEIREIASFGNWVRHRRQLMGWTRPELTQRLACAVITVKKIERDERRPSLQMAELLADQLAVPRARRADFLRMARGKYVPSLSVAQLVLHPPAFLRQESRSSPRSEPQFVARQAELAQLEAYLKKALDGDGRVFFILGEAGSGKTTLLQEFARQTQASDEDLIVARGQCNAQAGSGDPYLPFRDVMECLTGNLEARWAAGDLTQENAIRLWELLPHTVQAIGEHGPDLVDLLFPGMPLLNRLSAHLSGPADRLEAFHSMLSSPGPKSSKLEQVQVLEQATQVLKALSAQKPLLLALDDLQWIDEASINLLFHLGRRLMGSRILILGAYRPSEIALGFPGDSQEQSRHPLEPVIQEFKRQYGEIQIDLSRLKPQEGRAFVELLLDSEPNELSHEFRDSLYTYTQGQPLFTVELLRSMQENGTLIKNEAGRWVESLAWSPHQLPARVEAVIEQRLGRLDQSLQEILSVASVEGEQFTAQVVAHVLGTDERSLLRRLSRDLQQRNNLVREQGEVQVNGQPLDSYRFGHILFQEFLYRQLSQGELRLDHRLMGLAWEELLFADSPPEGEPLPVSLEAWNQAGQDFRFPEQLDKFGPALVRHFWMGEEWSKAVTYATWMGLHAMKVYALRAAIDYFQQALQALDKWGAAPGEAICDAILRWVGAAFKFRPYQEQLERLARADEIARALDDRPRLVQALHWRANVLLARGLWTTAAPILMECLALVEALGNQQLSVRPIYCKGLLATYENPGAALELLAQSATLAQHYQDRHIEALAHATMAQVEAQLGAFDASRQEIGLARQLVGTTGSPLTQSDVDLLTAWAYLAMGEVQHGLEFGQRSVEKAIATDNMDCVCSALACVGYGLLEMQRIPEAASAFQGGFERSEISGATIPRLMCQAGLAMTRFCNGDTRAVQDLEVAMQAMQANHNQVGAAHAAQMLGKCLLQSGQWQGAEEHFQNALDYYRRMEMRPFQARTLLSLAQVYDMESQQVRAQKARSEAQAMLHKQSGSSQ